jgi:hypothetical protein
MHAFMSFTADLNSSLVLGTSTLDVYVPKCNRKRTTQSDKSGHAKAVLVFCSELTTVVNWVA